MGTFEFTDDHDALRDVVRGFAAEVFSESEVRRLLAADSPLERPVWERMARQLGLQGLIVPEEHGGAGAGAVELAIVLEEFGRRLVPAPFLSTALATLALLDGDPSVTGEYLSRIADGQAVAAVGLAEDDGRWDATGVRCVAEQTAGEWRLTGAKSYVADGAIADLFVVAARGPAGVGLFLVDGDAAGLTRADLEVFDRTRRLARIELGAVSAIPLTTRSDAGEAFERFLDSARAAVAAEQVGGASFALDMAVGYAKERVQFGRAIGSFQAIKHMCADAYVDVESARSAAYYAAWAIADGNPEAATVAPLAKAFCSDTFFETAATNMQVAGGISFTDEYPAHLYFRRAKSGAQLWGSPRTQRDLLASRIGL
ncbi:acyl-CoA dehydrogenase family protein [Cryptosporangium aurantiacum]|uniref:Acyl-CoA dehydrogenase n=1 Tax=Cryptosporangium aurantiacum TaxID=134849 RepID=A0A1M7PJM5_9ACTN|nr:acyl-CoA dehydrogenase family protein [Cryptosporangium aurantiacum]SHN17398.1 Acyl-CoA dehydrogenase [Cryptosporangium aurantiacum]